MKQIKGDTVVSLRAGISITTETQLETNRESERNTNSK